MYANMNVTLVIKWLHMSACLSVSPSSVVCLVSSVGYMHIDLCMFMRGRIVLTFILFLL